MIKKILITFIAAIAAIVVYAQLTRPDTFYLASTMVINAPAEKIFHLINDFTNWPKWSPYEKLDPKMAKIFSGPQAGTGAAYSWNGDSNVGAGNIQITDSIQPSTIKLDLNMVRPFENHNKVEFTLNQKDGMTEVTWAMTGPATFMGKVVGMLFSDNMVKQQFSEGLTNLKAIAEQ